MKNILVAVDLDASSQLLINTAAEQAEKFNAKVWVLHITDPEPDFVGNKAGPQYVRDYLVEEIKKEHKLIRQYTEELIAKGIVADGLLIQGPTVKMILEEIEKLQIDLLIIGHQRRSLLFKIFIGDNHTALVNKSTIPVLVVPLF